MQLDKLVLDLHPRSNLAALDLGFTLLRAAPKSVWQVWLILWLPLMALVTLTACLWPNWATLWLLIPWWLLPLLERAPLYVLSRSVFGETVSWQQALKAFPGQLGGGLPPLLLLRPLMAGRCLRQPIWQLEGARGKTAANRFHVISRHGAAGSAFWFGIACLHFEVILQIGSLGLISLFLPASELINPFQIFIAFGNNEQALSTILISYGAYALAGGIIGPVYTACGLTLYLNRRATLEAWDIEINLRQIEPPTAIQRPAGTLARTPARTLPARTLASLLLFCILGAGLPDSHAAGNCTPPPDIPGPTEAPPAAVPHPQRKQLQQTLEKLYQSEALQEWSCEKQWKLRKSEDAEQEPAQIKVVPPSTSKRLDQLAGLIKLILIGSAIALIAWFGWRFRSHWLALLPQMRSAAPLPQVAGLDIRPQSLPDDVVQAVMRLWREGQQRAALALLYRATLSHLVTRHRLLITPGATEADCLELARLAHLGPERPPVLPLPESRWQVLHACTSLWLAAAWGNRWPETAQIERLCQQWQMAFIANLPTLEGSATGSAGGSAVGSAGGNIADKAGNALSKTGGAA